MGEVEKGWVSTPKPITDGIINPIPLSPRFAIEEQHGNAAQKKIRLICDFKRSEFNSLLKLRDASAPNTLDTAFAVARAFPPSWPKRHPHAHHIGMRSRVQTHWCAY